MLSSSLENAIYPRSIAMKICLDKMTKRICEIYETELQIKKDCIYVKYEECYKWGWNGSNF